MNYFTADTYKNWERVGEPFTNSKGKLYTKVKCQCDRCHKGTYVTRVENGQPVPHPAFGGVCLKCGGSGFLAEEVRLYTESEYTAMARRKEQDRLKKEQEQKEKMQAEYADKKAKWLVENGFNDSEVTYIYFPSDSYEVKEELKSAGFKFNPILMWHRESNIGYEDKVIALPFAAVGEFSAWGKGEFFSYAKDTVQTMLNEARPHAETEWAAAVKNKISNVEVTLTKSRSFDGMYGTTYIYTFVEGKHVYVWFTSKILPYAIGDTVVLSGTVKEHKDYLGEHQTVVTRCRVEACNEVK